MCPCCPATQTGSHVDIDKRTIIRRRGQTGIQDAFPLMLRLRHAGRWVQGKSSNCIQSFLCRTTYGHRRRPQRPRPRLLSWQQLSWHVLLPLEPLPLLAAFQWRSAVRGAPSSRGSGCVRGAHTAAIVSSCSFVPDLCSHLKQSLNSVSICSRVQTLDTRSECPARYAVLFSPTSAAFVDPIVDRVSSGKPTGSINLLAQVCPGKPRPARMRGTSHGQLRTCTHRRGASWKKKSPWSLDQAFDDNRPVFDRRLRSNAVSAVDEARASRRAAAIR